MMLSVHSSRKACFLSTAAEIASVIQGLFNGVLFVSFGWASLHVAFNVFSNSSVNSEKLTDGTKCSMLVLSFSINLFTLELENSYSL